VNLRSCLQLELYEEKDYQYFKHSVLFRRCELSFLKKCHFYTFGGFLAWLVGHVKKNKKTNRGETIEKLLSTKLSNSAGFLLAQEIVSDRRFKKINTLK